MHGTSYYNENDPYAASWLRNLIAAGHIAPGDVDERSIVDVRPSDLTGYVQCHFFAGIGVWSHSLRRAGWSDDRPVWTGSCPCQPFSAAGKGGGLDDERHLWPAFYHLIEKCRPAIVIGEQVASKDGLAWLDLVQADMEGSGYAFGALDLCAAGFGAPHIRQRLYWLADADSQDQGGRGIQRPGQGNGAGAGATCERPTGFCATGELGVSKRAGLEGFTGHGDSAAGRSIKDRSVATASSSNLLADADGRNASAEGLQRSGQHGFIAQDGSVGHNKPSSQTSGRWGNVDWLFCRDGKWRPVEPGTFPLAHGIAGRVGRLRAYGNAIVATQAQEFIAAYLGS